MCIWTDAAPTPHSAVGGLPVGRSSSAASATNGKQIPLHPFFFQFGNALARKTGAAGISVSADA
jgi:hypothetical protein